jgi:hypothetical protein
MFLLILQIAKTLKVPINLFNNSSFYIYFSNWYYYNHHYWEYIPTDESSIDSPISSGEDDWYISSTNIPKGDYSENNHIDDFEEYISDTGSDFDMAEFDSYYYEYVGIL